MAFASLTLDSRVRYYARAKEIYIYIYTNDRASRDGGELRRRRRWLPDDETPTKLVLGHHGTGK